jgi:pimeloyl-ACP methyl ester carboxylesterase
LPSPGVSGGGRGEWTLAVAARILYQRQYMTNAPTTQHRKRSGLRRWIRRGFLLWAVISTLWLANSYRTRGVADAMLRSNPAVSVVDGAATLEFLPALSDGRPALIFLCGSGVAAYAYAPLLRPIAEAGYAVFVVKLPYRFAPLEAHKQAAVERGRGVIAAHPEFPQWVVAGHSLGGALACRVTQADPTAISAMVLIGTTHPKLDDLSTLEMPITKVWASKDGVATPVRTRANKELLPLHTKWVGIEGGNHSQFGHYGHQLFDGKPTVAREAQQTVARSALLEALIEAER